jgi:hypothetical protein
MPTDQLDTLRMSFADSVLLLVTLLPLVMIGGVLIYRIRVSRRFSLLVKQNREALDQAATRGQEAAARTDKMIALNEEAHGHASARWQEAAARTEQMIALLTEIRDHMARIAPGSPDLPSGNS